MAKTKFKTYYDVIGEKEGTTFNDESLANQDAEKETNVKAMLERYGMGELVRRTTAKETLANYIDISEIGNVKTYDEVLEMRDKMTEYYRQLPAFLRKKFGDNEDLFIEKFQNGEFDDFINGEIITQEMADTITAEREARKQEYKNQIREQVIAEYEAKKEIEGNAGQNVE